MMMISRFRRSTPNRTCLPNYSHRLHSQERLNQPGSCSIKLNFIQQPYFKMADDEDLNPHEWEKPAWAKEGPKLRSTGKAEVMKTAGNLAGPITDINKQKDETRDINPVATNAQLNQSDAHSDKNLAWEKPDWTKSAGLKTTKKGEKLKTKGDLARPITFPKGKN